MARHNDERKMGRRIAILTAACERKDREVAQARAAVEEAQRAVNVLERELVFARAHLNHHHPADGKTCGWERDLMIRMDSAIEKEKENAHG